MFVLLVLFLALAGLKAKGVIIGILGFIIITPAVFYLHHKVTRYMESRARKKRRRIKEEQRKARRMERKNRNNTTRQGQR